MIAGLSGQVDEELLKDAFASFGQVIDGMCVIFPMDDNNHVGSMFLVEMSFLDETWSGYGLLMLLP